MFVYVCLIMFYLCIKSYGKKSVLAIEGLAIAWIWKQNEWLEFVNSSSINLDLLEIFFTTDFGGTGLAIPMDMIHIPFSNISLP